MGIVTAGTALTIGEVISVELLVDSPDKASPLRAMVCFTDGPGMGLQFLPSQETDKDR